MPTVYGKREITYYTLNDVKLFQPRKGMVKRIKFFISSGAEGYVRGGCVRGLSVFLVDVVTYDVLNFGVLCMETRSVEEVRSADGARGIIV